MIKLHELLKIIIGDRVVKFFYYCLKNKLKSLVGLTYNVDIMVVLLVNE